MVKVFRQSNGFLFLAAFSLAPSFFFLRHLRKIQKKTPPTTDRLAPSLQNKAGAKQRTGAPGRKAEINHLVLWSWELKVQANQLAIKENNNNAWGIATGVRKNSQGHNKVSITLWVTQHTECPSSWAFLQQIDYM